MEEIRKIVSKLRARERECAGIADWEVDEYREAIEKLLKVAEAAKAFNDHMQSGTFDNPPDTRPMPKLWDDMEHALGAVDGTGCPRIRRGEGMCDRCELEGRDVQNETTKEG